MRSAGENSKVTIANDAGIQMGSDSAGVKSLFEISGGVVTNNVWNIGIADAGQAGSESKLVVKGNGEYYSTLQVNLGYKSTGYLKTGPFWRGDRPQFAWGQTPRRVRTLRNLKVALR